MLLNRAEDLFCTAYALHQDGPTALLVSGIIVPANYTPETYSRRLLKKPRIKARVDQTLKQMMAGQKHHHAAQVAITNKWLNADLTDIIDENGFLKKFKHFPKEISSQLSEVSIGKDGRVKGKIRIMSKEALFDKLLRLTGGDAENTKSTNVNIQINQSQRGLTDNELKEKITYLIEEDAKEGTTSSKVIIEQEESHDD